MEGLHVLILNSGTRVQTAPLSSMMALVPLENPVPFSSTQSIINSFLYQGLLSRIFVFHGLLTYFTVLILFHCPTLIKAVTPVVFVLRNQNVPLARNGGKVNRN